MMHPETRRKVRRLIGEAEDHLSNVDTELDQDLDQAGLAADLLAETAGRIATLIPASQPPASTDPTNCTCSSTSATPGPSHSQDCPLHRSPASTEGTK